MQLFTHKSADCVECCISVPLFGLFLPSKRLANLFYSCVKRFPSSCCFASDSATADLQYYCSHKNKVNLFQPITILESIAYHLYPIRNHYIFPCRSLTSHNTIRVSFSQTFPPSRFSSGEGTARRRLPETSHFFNQRDSSRTSCKCHVTQKLRNSSAVYH